MKKYPKMKDSEIEWIGEIPEHWEIKKLKYLGKAITGLTFSPNEIVDEDKHGILVLRASNIQNGKLSLLDTIFLKTHIVEELFTQEGDILICSRNGSKHLIGKNLTITNKTARNTFGAFMTVFRSKYNDYISKVLNSRIFTEQTSLFMTTTINQLTLSTLNNFHIPFPKEKSERIKIANFLNKKISNIDFKISKNKKLIELLKEKKHTLINQAVTKGLDISVPMKNSGIDWIGEIPEHWELIRLQFLADITTGGKNTEDKEVDGEFPFFVRSQNIKKISSYSCDEEAVLTAGDGVGVAKVFHYINGKFDFHQRVYKMSNFRKILGKYFFYSFTENFKKEIFKGTAKSTVDSLRLHMIQNFLFAFGTEEEQKNIIDYIEIQNKKIDYLISKTDIQIKKLYELRESLIASTITGKINVEEIVV